MKHSGNCNLVESLHHKSLPEDDPPETNHLHKGLGLVLVAGKSSCCSIGSPHPLLLEDFGSCFILLFSFPAAAVGGSFCFLPGGPETTPFLPSPLSATGGTFMGLNEATGGTGPHGSGT